VSAATSAPLLAVRDLAVSFHTPYGVVRAVDGVGFDLAPGEFMGLVGESGSGKTVTCRAMLGLLPNGRGRVDGGTALFEGVDLLRMDDEGLRRVRGRRIGMVFQNPTSHLDPVMSIGEQIGEVVRLHHGLAAGAARVRAVELLRGVRMPDPETRIDSYAHQLSGGMRQRAMIAMALAGGPALLVADEPTTALDVTVQAQILRLLLDLRDSQGLAIVLVTHDLGIVLETCNTVAVMYAGRIVERGPAATVLAAPRHPYTIGLLGSRPGAFPRRERLAAIPGQPPGPGALPTGCAFAPRCGHAEARCAAAAPTLRAVGDGRWVACVREGWS